MARHGRTKGDDSFLEYTFGKRLHKFRSQRKFGLAMVLSVLCFGALFWFLNIALVIVGILVLNAAFVWSVKKRCVVPLAVNLNHPFMESGSVSDSEVMVKFSESWIDPGINRLKLAKDSLGCWVVHKQDDDLTVLSLWDTTQEEIVLNKKLSIINQAISLNNAVNDSNDEFEDARERESQESGLLERKWLPEEELDVQGPISRIFSNDS